MTFTETKLKGCYILDIERREDDRGFFARIMCTEELRAHGLTADFAQENASTNHRAGTIRGMHYQREPHAEAKLVRCTKGSVFDVAVDVRPGSPTYLQWVGVELTEENYRMFYVPEGFAHGYLSLTDGAAVSYLVSHPYVPGTEGGIRFDDPAVGIEWPRAVVVVSEKDRAWPLLAAPATVGGIN